MWQVWCWTHPWRVTAQLLVLAALLSFCSTFGGLVVLHGYLAASNQTTYELSRGAKARLANVSIANPKPFTATWRPATRPSMSSRAARRRYNSQMHVLQIKP